MLGAIQHWGCRLAIVLVLGVTGCGPKPSQRQTSEPQPTATSPDGIWSQIGNENVLPEKSIINVRPTSFAAFHLDPAKLKRVLDTLSPEYSPEGNDKREIMTLPAPDGSFGRFQIEESSIMEPALAERFPQIKAFEGRGLDDPTATARFEQTPEGLHVMVMSASGTFFVDAIEKNGTGPYVSYFHSSLPPDPFGVSCLIKGQNRNQYPGKKSDSRHHMFLAAGDSSLRTYRLAIAASHRYVAAIHNSINPTGSAEDLVNDAFTAIHRTINRVNLIFRTELGIRFVLITDETKIIYVNEADDPYSGTTDSDQLLEMNQENLDQEIGSARYDIGHLFIAESGGVASQPCACNQSFKAQGLSGRPQPLGNAFDVNIVAHEIGHQFGASHSFNGTTAGCQFRNPETAYEPGSGSTIMSYASASQICGPETVQALKDPYFHAISLKEISNYITDTSPGSGDSCPRKTATSNLHRPTVAAEDHIIPKGTPFTLAVAGSSDGDGDTLVYSWEEFDLGEPDPPQPTDLQDFKKIRPLFRSFQWSTKPSRTFPALAHIINPPTNYIAESLPATGRTMVFRVTARDTRGRYGFDDVQIRVLAKHQGAGVGPFVVIQPGAGAVWRRGSTQTVSWSVANTRASPIDCQSVKISLLINGDEAHPVVLVNSAPNNGAKIVTLPTDAPLTTTARIKVEARNNVFFSVSATDIQIVP